MTFISSRPALPITSNEFFQMFMKSTPPPGWNPRLKIAVGNSGGPDSTCLLFLLNRLLNERVDNPRERAKLPSSAVSLTVNHDLQEASTAMAAHSGKMAISLDVEHHTLHIPWDKPPFPAKPVASFEEKAREARFHVLFQAMTRTNAAVLAFGHHADDQVETSLMRLARGTTEIGAAGMRRCRRWGMGAGSREGELGWAGLEGMNRWIIRPLLEVRKDRILATCHEHGLEYVTDQTNFQPEITLRNAIRCMLAEEEEAINGTKLESSLPTKEMPQEITDFLEKIKKASAELQSTALDISGGREQLRGAVKHLSSRVEDIDNQVTAYLRQLSFDSPTSTFLLSTHRLSRITDNAVQRAIILRIMRYVSFHPWGSLRADGNRRRSSLQRLINKIWAPEGYDVRPTAFTAGGGVLWSPAIIKSDGCLKTIGNGSKTTVMRAGDRFAWLASRLPAVPINTFSQLSNLPPELNVDITPRILEQLKLATSGRSSDCFLDVLYDCRFLLRFDISKLPNDLIEFLNSCPQSGWTLRIVPTKRFYWPRVVLRSPGQEEQRVLMSFQPPESRQPQDADAWLTTEFIRVLDAT